MSTEADMPLDTTLTRRWFLNRFAWVTTAAAAGSTLLPGVASAAKRGDENLPEEAYAASVRGQAQRDLTELTISEALTLLRSNKVTPADLVNALLDRIDAYDSVYQAYAARPSRAALLAAARNLPRNGALRGIGLAPKDNFYTADLPTEAGSLVFAGFQPDYDATAVRLFREAGALVLGKARMGNLAGGRATQYGTTIPTTRNAWTPDDVRYSPAGSSSGTATAVAARMAFGGIGTQTGGSVTGPGTAQGLTCVKPTFGRISLHGVIPLTYTRDHVGPMARTAMDAAILL